MHDYMGCAQARLQRHRQSEAPLWMGLKCNALNRPCLNSTKAQEMYN